MLIDVWKLRAASIIVILGIPIGVRRRLYLHNTKCLIINIRIDLTNIIIHIIPYYFYCEGLFSCWLSINGIYFLIFAFFYLL